MPNHSQKTKSHAVALIKKGAKFTEVARLVGASQCSISNWVKQDNPTFKAKYRDPVTGKAWTGRGRPPRWLTDAEQSGKSRDAFLIAANDSTIPNNNDQAAFREDEESSRNLLGAQLLRPHSISTLVNKLDKMEYEVDQIHASIRNFIAAKEDAAASSRELLRTLVNTSRWGLGTVLLALLSTIYISIA